MRTKISAYREKLKIRFKEFEYLIIDSFGWIKSIYILLFRNIKLPGIFYGYQSFKLATKYAEKRTRKWQNKWDQMGRIQGVMPLDDTKLIVCSKMELAKYKKLKMLNPKLKIKKAIKKAYYKTAI